VIKQKTLILLLALVPLPALFTLVEGNWIDPEFSLAISGAFYLGSTAALCMSAVLPETFKGIYLRAFVKALAFIVGVFGGWKIMVMQGASGLTHLKYDTIMALFFSSIAIFALKKSAVTIGMLLKDRAKWLRLGCAAVVFALSYLLQLLGVPWRMQYSVIVMLLIYAFFLEPIILRQIN